MTNKEKALVDVITLFLAAAALPALLVAVLNYLIAVFTVEQVFTGIGISFMVLMLIGIGRMYYGIRLDQLNTLDKLRSDK